MLLKCPVKTGAVDMLGAVVLNVVQFKLHKFKNVSEMIPNCELIL